MTRWLLDGSYQRPADGDVVIAGSPLRLFRLGPRGREIVAAIERGENPPAGHHPLTDRLVDAGALHPDASGEPQVSPTQITIVVPLLGPPPELTPTALRRLVVDDGTNPPVMLPGGAGELLRLPDNRGPAAARNAGLSRIDTPFVAFVDADATIDDACVMELTRHFVDERVALVAPRIRSIGRGPLAQYEADHGPLDMGGAPARVAQGSRVSYVPGAVLVCRTEALRSVDGFDESLRFGEDVDLVWRLVAAGWRCRYEPSVEARHATRETVDGWLRQRFHYGTSAAALEQRHPGALAPVRTNAWSAAAWLPVAAGWPALGVAVAATSTALLPRRLPGVPARVSLMLAARGNLTAGRTYAETLRRTWWPMALIAALMSRRARRALLAALVVPRLLDRWRAAPEGGLDPVRALVAGVGDDLAYGAGVWAGCVRERTIAPLVPTFSPWPPRDSHPTPKRSALRQRFQARPQVGAVDAQAGRQHTPADELGEHGAPQAEADERLE